MSVFLDRWRGRGVVRSWIERESEKVPRAKLTCTFVFWLRRDVRVKWNQKPDLEFRGGFRQMYEVCLRSGSCALPFETRDSWEPKQDGFNPRPNVNDTVFRLFLGQLKFYYMYRFGQTPLYQLRFERFVFVMKALCWFFRGQILVIKIY